MLCLSLLLMTAAISGVYAAAHSMGDQLIIPENPTVPIIPCRDAPQESRSGHGTKISWDSHASASPSYHISLHDKYGHPIVVFNPHSSMTLLSVTHTSLHEVRRNEVTATATPYEYHYATDAGPTELATMPIASASASSDESIVQKRELSRASKVSYTIIEERPTKTIVNSGIENLTPTGGHNDHRPKNPLPKGTFSRITSISRLPTHAENTVVPIRSVMGSPSPDAYSMRIFSSTNAPEAGKNPFRRAPEVFEYIYDHSTSLATVTGTHAQVYPSRHSGTKTQKTKAGTKNTPAPAHVPIPEPRPIVRKQEINSKRTGAKSELDGLIHSIGKAE